MISLIEEMGFKVHPGDGERVLFYNLNFIFETMFIFVEYTF
jgi:hypothetical protein